MLVKKNGIWQPIQNIFVKQNGSWIEGETLFKVSGKWVSRVPSNAVVLYRDYASVLDGFLCDGNNNTPDLINSGYTTQIYGASVFGDTGGSVSHSGTLHGSFTTSITSANRSDAIANGLKTCYFLSGSTHADVIPSHTHDSDGSNFGKGSYGLLPYLGCSKLYEGAIIPSANTQSVAFLTYQATLINYLIGISSSNATEVIKNAESHNHGNQSCANELQTTCAIRGLSGKWENNLPNYYIHGHTITHTAETKTPIPQHYNAIPYEVTTTTYFSDLPSGSIMLFTTPMLPVGWSRFTIADDYLLAYGSSSGIVAGDGTTHSHSASVTSSGYRNISASGGYDTYGSAASFNYWGSHNITWTDNHSTLVEHLPPYIKFIIGIKD